MLRNTRGWIGAATAAGVVVAGAAAGAQASSSGSPPVRPRPTAPAETPSAKVVPPPDPHETAAQHEADRIITTFQPPPGAEQAARRPDPLPPYLRSPPEQSAAQTQAAVTAWFLTTQSPDQVLAWVRANPPTGSAWSGSGSGTSGSFLSYQFGSSDSQLIITPATGSDGRTVIRIDASVIWTPSRGAGTLLGYGAPSVSVVTTNTLNPQMKLPTAESTPVTATDPVVVRKVVDLLNALQPPIPEERNCAVDDGTRVRITLPGVAAVSADPGGCGDVTITPQGGAPQDYAGGTELVTKVYALFGVTWSRSGNLPQGTGRTAAAGSP